MIPKILLAACTFLLLLNGAHVFAKEESRNAEVSSTENSTPEPTGQASPGSSTSTSLHKVDLFFYEKGTGLPLKRVEVTAGPKKLFSDPKGFLSIEITKDSDGFLRANRKGFEEKSISSAQLLKNTSLKVFLYPKVSDDDVIIVKGERRTNVSRKTITIQESKKIAPNGDPAQIIKLLPGVQTQGFGGAVIIRGSGPNDSRYYIDDLEVPFIYHTIGQISVIPAELMSEVQFDSGGFSAQYGNATGGVIVLNTVNDIPKRPMTKFVVNVPLYSGIYHERPLSEDSSLSVGVRRSYIDLFIQAILDKQAEDGEGGGLTISPHFADAHVRYLKKNEDGHMKYTLLAAEDGLTALFPSDFSANETGTSQFKINTSFANFGVERLHRINRDWKYRSTPQVYYAVNDNNFAGNLININVTKIRIPTEFTKRLSKSEDLYIGFDPTYVKAKVDIFSIIPNFDDPTFDFEDAPKEKINRTQQLNTFSAWVEGDRQLGDLKLTPGVRGFYNSQISKTSYDPRLRGSYAVSNANSIKIAVGQYTKDPEPQEAGKDAGNPDLDFEKSTHYIAGLTTKWSDAWTTEFQLFQKRAYDVVTRDPVTYYNNDGSFRSKGFELFIRRNLTARLFGWISYTYSKTETRDSDETDFMPSQYDQTHVLNFASSYRLSHDWEVGARYNHHTGDTRSPIERAVYNGNLDKYQPRDNAVNKNTSRLPNYNNFSLYATRNILFDSWKMDFKFGVESYWPEEQVLEIGYNYDYSKEEPQAGPPVIPFIEFGGEL